ncbi:MAG: hypothetical protein AMJ68_11095 [Acidithiobacillales bacterium SG8_45]|nr:MAG: hypothetical protein AMJ68_11095 [Acidithiobacillales bacterium SG8_45]
MRTKFVVVTLLVLVSFNAYAFFKLPLFGSPADSALLVVEGELYFKDMFGRVKRTPITAATVSRPKDNRFVKISAHKGMVVFSKMAPGRYVLTEINAQPGNKELNLQPDLAQQKQFAIEIKAGDIGYIGKLDVEAEFSLKRIGSTFVFQKNGAIELNAVKTLKNKYKKSKWVARFDQRIAELSK